MADIRHLDINGTNKSISTIDSAVVSALGDISGASIIQKFGRDDAVATTFKPVCIGGIYKMPQVSGATTLRVKAGDAADTLLGAGARKVYLHGLDETGAYVHEELETNGASAGTAGTVTWIRVFRAYVSESGAYGDIGTLSQAADIVIETTGGVAWLTIKKDAVIGFCQSEIGFYTVPLGKKAILLDYNITFDTTKVVDFAFMKRESILDTAPPYQAWRVQFQGVGLDAPWKHSPHGGLVFNELTDIGFFTRGASTPGVSVDFTMLQINA